MDKKKVEEKADEIIEAAEEIKEEIEPKRAKTYGDPCVTLY